MEETSGPAAMTAAPRKRFATLKRRKKEPSITLVAIRWSTPKTTSCLPTTNHVAAVTTNPHPKRRTPLMRYFLKLPSRLLRRELLKVRDMPASATNVPAVNRARYPHISSCPGKGICRKKERSKSRLEMIIKATAIPRRQSTSHILAVIFVGKWMRGSCVMYSPDLSGGCMWYAVYSNIA